MWMQELVVIAGRVVRQGAKTPPRSDSVLKRDRFSISRLERCDDSLGRVVVESYCPYGGFFS